MLTEQFECGIRTITLNSWEDFDKGLTARGSYVWRGQRNAEWKLLSAFDRIFPEEASLSEREAKAEEHIERFRYLMRGHLSESLELALGKRQKINDWWALGQQCGLVTPLLSWSSSPYVALYFAIRNFSKFREDVSSFIHIWGLPPLERINDSLRSRITEHNLDRFQRKCDRICVAAFYPYQAITCRLTSQAVFFTKAPYGVALEDWIATNGCPDEENLLCLKIPFTRSTAKQCLLRLNEMNINPLTLWPAREGCSLLANIALQVDDYHCFW